MGLVLEDAKLLLDLSRSTARFGKTLTLGRQQLFFSPEELVPALREAQVPDETISSFLIAARDQGPAEPLFELLGSESVASLDASDYEGATLRHDLNTPVDPALHDSYDLVFDGGTLEHVFNFPVGLRNAMEMVKPGGTLVIVTPANNQVGHGFYQFSPELFYNVLSAQNGFEVQKLVAVEHSPAHRCFAVADPSKVRSRVILSSSWPVNLFVQARKTSRVPMFTKSPQQTDYVAQWTSPASKPAEDESTPGPGQAALKQSKRWLQQRFPKAVFWTATVSKLLRDQESDFRNTRFFQKLDK